MYLPDETLVDRLQQVFVQNERAPVHDVRPGVQHLALRR